MPSRRRDPFAVKMTPAQRQDITTRLVEEVRTGLQARSQVMQDNGLIDWAYALYEQERQRDGVSESDGYGSADLTSPIWMENVDAISARAARNIFRQDPMWVVEGIGPENQQKEPYVEAFMQMRQEDMRLQATLKKAVTAAFVEFGSVVEICEDAEATVRRETVRAAVMMTDGADGLPPSPILDAKGRPQPQLDEQGAPVPAADGDENYVEVEHVYEDYRRRGAYPQLRSMKNFMFLPNHASDPREVWGHASRFWLTKAELDRRVEDGLYDAESVALFGSDPQDRQQQNEQDRAHVNVQHTPGYGQGEAELWRVQVWLDPKGTGEYALYTAVVSERHNALLSLQYDWLQRFRTVYVNPNPCPYSVYGYSLVLTKLLTIGEEHTAWRNMNADRGTLKAQAPLKRLRGSQWDPRIQPFGAGRTIDVGDMNEIMPFEFEDISQQSVGKEQQCVVDAQRVTGMNDIALGQTNTQSRTLGENQMATTQSFVRSDDPISNIDEALEDIGEIIHAIEVQTLRESGRALPATSSIASTLSRVDEQWQGAFSVDQISGRFKFKPRSSSEDADPKVRESRFANGVNAIMLYAKVNPLIAQRLASPEMAAALMQEVVTFMKPRDRGPFLDPLQPPQAPMGMPGMPMPGMPPGAPPGPPGAGAGPPQDMQSAILSRAMQALPLPTGTVQ